MGVPNRADVKANGVYGKSFERWTIHYLPNATKHSVVTSGAGTAVSDITADVDVEAEEVENAVNAADFQLEQRMSDARDALQTLPRKKSLRMYGINSKVP